MKKIRLKLRIFLLSRQKKIQSRYNKPRPSKRVIRGRVGFRHIEMPNQISLKHREPRKRLINVLKNIRNSVYVAKKSIVLDFKNTDSVLPSGMLLLLAEISRLKDSITRGTKILCIPPRNEKVGQVFKQVGLFNLLEFVDVDINPHFSDVIHWRYARGHTVEGVVFENIFDRFEGRISELLSSGMYVSLTEAMTNSLHHAYIGLRQDSLNIINPKKNWWMFSHEKDNRLFVAFCDLGVGIPGSLPEQNPTLWKDLVGHLVGKDGLIIKAAVEEGSTRTGKTNRGKGLYQMVEFIKTVEEGFLTIYSNRGVYSVDDKTELHHTYTESIFGTLIEWSIPLPKSVN